MWLTAPEAARAQGLDLSRGARTRKETSAAIWRRMHEGSWPYSLRIRQVPQAPSEHTDAVVAVDRWGNAAALTHTINANLWGETGIFVGGVSVPDPAAFQQAQVKAAGPGGRLPDTMSPTIVLLDGKPVLATSATGSGLHEKTTQVLVDVLEFGADLPAGSPASRT